MTEKGVFIRYTIIADSFIPLSELRKMYGKKSAEELAKKEIEEMEYLSKYYDEQDICLHSRRVLVKKVTGRVTDKILPRDV